MLSSIFQAMPLYAWIIIGCVIILAVVVLIKMFFFTEKLSPSRQASQKVDKATKNFSEGKPLSGFLGGLKKRKSKNLKKRRKYKK